MYPPTPYLLDSLAFKQIQMMWMSTLTMINLPGKGGGHSQVPSSLTAAERKTFIVILSDVYPFRSRWLHKDESRTAGV